MTRKEAAEAIEELKASEWWERTVRRHMQHVKQYEEVGCPELAEPLEVFAADVLNTPKEFRDELLKVEELAPYIAFQRYPAYIAPTMEEQKLDFYSQAMGRKLR